MSAFKANSNLGFNAVEDTKIELKKSNFVERQGDWICMRCQNLNFSFRVVCNRCKISKGESEMIYQEQIHNYSNYVRFNEIIQKNILLNQGKTTNSNLFSINNSLNPFQTIQFFNEK